MLQAEEYKIKMKKIIIAILLLFAVSNVFSQATFTTEYTQSSPVFKVKMSADTSITEKYSDWADFSAIAGQTCYLLDSLKMFSTDSVLITIQGRVIVSGTPVIITCATQYVNTGIEANGLTWTTYAPEYRYKITQPRLKSWVGWFGLYANTTNYLRPHKRYGNLP